MRFRKAFLLFNDLEKPRWGKALSDTRSAYTSMKEHFLKNITNSEDLDADDPLNDSESVSNALFSIFNVL
jgi:TBC1 domain family protein 5